MEELSKKEMKLLLNKNREAFVRFYRTYASKLAVHINCYVKNIEDAKDITEDIFSNFYKYMKNYDSSKSGIYTYLCKIGKNLAVNYLSKESLVTTCEFNDKVYGKENKPNLMLLDLKEKMSDDEYNIMILKYINGLTAKEVSLIINVSERTIFRKLKTIEEIIKDYVEVNLYE